MRYLQKRVSGETRYEGMEKVVFLRLLCPEKLTVVSSVLENDFPIDGIKYFKILGSPITTVVTFLSDFEKRYQLMKGVKGPVKILKAPVWIATLTCEQIVSLL